jgi:23S rRNA (uracil1939-C5)-methyltransferase
VSRKNNLPLIQQVEIVDIGAEGKAIARIDGIVIFVPYVIPGDIVDIKVVKKRKNYIEALPVHIRSFSPDRINPPCEHFGTCGGCKWQILPYKQQLIHKEKQVLDNLTRIGKLNIPEISKIIASDNEYFYRNKLEFTFSCNRWLTREEIESGSECMHDALGFHIPEKFDKVLDINKCWLQRDPSNAIRDAVKLFALKNQMSFFDLRKQEGLLRNIIIRTSNCGELMVILSFFRNDETMIESLLNYITLTFNEITSLMYVINPKENDTISDLEILLFRGKDHIIEKMEDLRFKVGPKSFYQTNSDQALKLYQIVRDYANLTGKETVYDLYTGTGTIANYIAGMAKKVIGVEYIVEAVKDAADNSAFNQISNTLFFAGDIKDVLNNDFVEKQGRPDVIILDPPRAGVHPNVLEIMRKVMPMKIIYVSCNPATQARDLSVLNDLYNITRVQPVDMFPQTHHVENVVLLERK